MLTARDVALFASTGHVDHVAVSAVDATGVYGPTSAVATAAARAIVEAKVLGAMAGAAGWRIPARNGLVVGEVETYVGACRRILYSWPPR